MMDCPECGGLMSPWTDLDVNIESFICIQCGYWTDDDDKPDIISELEAEAIDGNP